MYSFICHRKYINVLMSNLPLSIRLPIGFQDFIITDWKIFILAILQRKTMIFLFLHRYFIYPLGFCTLVCTVQYMPIVEILLFIPGAGIYFEEFWYFIHLFFCILLLFQYSIKKKNTVDCKIIFSQRHYSKTRFIQLPLR